MTSGGMIDATAEPRLTVSERRALCLGTSLLLIEYVVLAVSFARVRSSGLNGAHTLFFLLVFAVWAWFSASALGLVLYRSWAPAQAVKASFQLAFLSVIELLGFVLGLWSATPFTRLDTIWILKALGAAAACRALLRNRSIEGGRKGTRNLFWLFFVSAVLGGFFEAAKYRQSGIAKSEAFIAMVLAFLFLEWRFWNSEEDPDDPTTRPPREIHFS